MRCRDFHRDLSAFIDGELGLERSEKVASHLAECGSCAAEFGALRQLVQWAEAIPEVEPPAALHGRILSAIEAPPSATAPSTAERAWGAVQRLGQTRPLAWVVSAGAAAALAVAVANPGNPYRPGPRAATSPPAVAADGSLARVPAEPGSVRGREQAARRSPFLNRERLRLSETAPKAVGTGEAARTVLPDRSSGAVDPQADPQPLLSQVLPAAETDSRGVEPPAPVSPMDGPGMPLMGMASMAKEATTPGEMTVAMPEKKMAGMGNPRLDDDGVAELFRDSPPLKDLQKDGKMKPL